MLVRFLYLLIPDAHNASNRNIFVNLSKNLPIICTKSCKFFTFFKFLKSKPTNLDKKPFLLLIIHFYLPFSFVDIISMKKIQKHKRRIFTTELKKSLNEKRNENSF